MVRARTLTKEEESYLSKLYYDEKRFYGRDRMFQYVKKDGKFPKLSRRKIMDWLRKQEVHQTTARKDKRQAIRMTELSGVRKQIMIDLIDMSTYEVRGFKWILTAIDGFSKRAWAFPMKTKNEKNSTAAISKLLKAVGRLGSLRSDNGSEFVNKSVTALLKKHNVKQVLSSAQLPQSNGQIERFNGILKDAIFKDIESGNRDWVKSLDIHLRNYNESYQTTIKKTPLEADAGQFADTKKQIKKKNKRNKRKVKIYNVGDHVRLSLVKAKTDKSPLNWTKDIYIIYKITKPRKSTNVRRYYVKTKKNGKKFTAEYLASDLMKVPPNTEVGSKSNNKQDNVFEISKLVRHMTRNKKPSYEVKWKGYPDSDNTIELRSQLLEDVPKLVRKYERENDYPFGNDK